MHTQKKSDRNQMIERLIFTAIIGTIILIMTFVDPLGYIPFGAVRLTLIHIPVIVGGIILGRKYGLILGLIFGLGSMVRSMFEYTFNAPFINPLVSVLPRMIFGFFVFDIYLFFKRIFKDQKVSIFFTAGASALFHSLIVLPILFIVWRYNFYPFVDEFLFSVDKEILSLNIFYFIYGILISNSLFETALAILIVTPIVIALQTLTKHKFKY